MITEASEHFLEEISTVAAAKKYNMTPSYVARLARTHTIRARKFGRDWIIDEKGLRDYLDQPRKPGPKPNRASIQTEAGSNASIRKGKYHAATTARGANETISQ